MMRVGFGDIQIVDRSPFGLDLALQFPLFTPDLIDLMRRLIPPDRQDEVAMSVIVTATNPS